MNVADSLAPRRLRQWSERNVTWVGAVLIFAILALAAWGIVRSYRAAVEENGRLLASGARIIAEQTARSVQATDIALANLAGEWQRGDLGKLSPRGLYYLLRGKAGDLVQTNGLALHDAEGNALGLSWMYPVDGPAANVANRAQFHSVRDNATSGLVIGNALRSTTDGQWFFPMSRRLTGPKGEFAGMISARGSIAYYQQFYRDIQPDVSLTVTLMHRDGTLVARYPAVDNAYGKTYGVIDNLLARAEEAGTSPLRVVSPVDGVERYAAVRTVPNYPLVVVLTRDVTSAMAGWQQQAQGTAVRTLALAAFAAGLLALLRQKVGRLERARESLEASRERFALAVAGSDDGIWDWDYGTGIAFSSRRGREIVGMPLEPETQPLAEWFELLAAQVHPDDRARRDEALDAHLAGKTPTYEIEYRARQADGNYRWVRIRGLCVRDGAGKARRMSGSVSDIDARKRAEESLRQSEERYALAMTGSRGGHWVWEVGTDALFVSGQLNQLFGLPEDTQATTRTAYFANVRLHADDRDAMAGVERNLRGGAERADFEYRIVLPSGDVRWISNRAQVFRDATGRPVRVAGVSIDISERKRTELALRQSEERYALAMTGSNEGHWVWELEADRVYASATMNQLFGLPPDAQMANWQDFFNHAPVPPDDFAEVQAAFRAHFEGQTPRLDVEHRIQLPDGTVRWLHSRGQCFRDDQGKAVRVAGATIDISDRKRAEDALRESEERYALAMAGSNEGHWAWNMVTDELFVSARLNEIFGRAAKPLVTTHTGYNRDIPRHPEDAAAVIKAREDHIAGLTPRFDLEYRILLPSGEVRWVHTRAQCFRDPSGRPLRMAGALTDITDRKRTEEALRESESRFALAVAGSNDGIVDWDIVNDRMFGSERALQILDLDTDVTVRTRAEWRDLIVYHPDDAERMKEDLRRCLEGETDVRNGEYRIRLRDGNYRWIRHRNKCLRDAQGRPLRLSGSVSDIDAQKRNEEALRESEERFALAVAGSDDGIFDWNYETGSGFGSPRAREILGLPPGPDVMPLADWFNAYEAQLHPEDVVARRTAVEAHLSGRTLAYEGEYRVRNHDGSWRWIAVRGLSVRRGDARPHRMAGSFTDIDARKRAEEALRLSEERLAIAMTGTHEAHWVWDLVTKQIYVSPLACDLFGLPPGTEIVDGIAGLYAYAPMHPDDLPRVEQAVADHLAGRTPRLDVEYRILPHGTNGTRWVHSRAQAFRNPTGRVTRMAGATVEVTERRLAEQALRESEERYALAIEGSNEGLWDWDLRKDSLFLSPRAQLILGFAPDDPLQTRREWNRRGTYHPDDLVLIRKAVSDHLHGLTKAFVVEYRMQSGGDPEWRWYRERGIALRDAAGKPYRMAGSLENITARKTAETQRAQLESQLRQAQKLEAIGTLAGGIAHDFNNILAAILGYGEMAQKDAAEGTPLRRHLDAALSAAMRAKSLVERILAFSRSGIGERVPVHVQGVVHEALDLAAASLPAGVELERHLDIGNAAVLGDPVQVHQVVMNLCANAAQAIRARGTITVTLEDRTLPEKIVTTSVLPAGRYVCLQVRDTGSGIPAHVLERIFDPFFTTKEVGVGTGLGLSLVHGIVADLGGGIDVASKAGEGAVFTVYMPWHANVSAPEPVAGAVEPGAGETILLVDDEETLVRLGEEMIAELGYEPVGFTSSLAALASFRAEPTRFHAVLSDEAMPDMTGSEMAREIRAIRPDIPIVLMSGYVTAALAARAREAGVAEVLNKPLARRDIARSLAAALRRDTAAPVPDSPAAAVALAQT